jgi:peptide/nickel transport system permease protein
MAEMIARRIFQSVITILALSFITFAGIYLIGNPIEVLADESATALEIQRLTERLGLDQPLHIQYLAYMGRLLTGDLGNSLVTSLPVSMMIVQRLPATLEMTFVAIMLSVCIGLPLGILAGVFPRHPLSRAVTVTSIFGFSLPNFWLGLMLLLVFAVYNPIFPSIGRGDTVEVLGAHWSILTLDGLQHMILPAFTLAVGNIALLLRLAKAGMQEVMQLDYIKLARIKGLSPWRVVMVHALRNVMIPIVTIIGLEIGGLVAGSIITETVFAWPGIGKLLIDSINMLDRPVVVAYMMIFTFVFVIINLIVDLSYMILDPRAREGMSR